MKRRNSIQKTLVALPALLLSIALLSACDDELDSTSVVPQTDSELWDSTQIGRYIYENYTRPYNIRIIYRWEDGRQDFSKYLVPAKEEKIIPFLQMLKRVWMEPYVEITTQAGEPGFFRSYVPKEMLIVGSPAINSDGTITLGFAESGRQILLYNVNELSATQSTDFVMFLHTMHHEFAHIMQQENKSYDTKYRAISSGDYTASWVNTSNQQARRMGFVTAYARADVDEDFVETLTVKLVNHPRGWDFVYKELSGEGADKIQSKTDLMASYMKEIWKIDMDAFELLVHNAIRNELTTQEGAPLYRQNETFIFDGNDIIGRLNYSNPLIDSIYVNQRYDIMAGKDTLRITGSKGQVEKVVIYNK